MIAGRYTRDREIGRGGMGAVWLGRDEVLGRPVAIKRVGILPGDSGPDASPQVARAEREAKIAASLNHPHIVGIYDLVSEDDQQWMVMEYVEGVTLSDLIRTHGPMSPAEAAPVIAQAASALAAAHANGVVHRDVKPSNIMVREDGHVKLTDFGIARGQTDAALTQTGLVTGSPAYLAPEVATGQQATPASDVWSLGATLFHALAGHPPYDATDNVLGALYRIVNEAPPRIEHPGHLAPLLESTMTRKPAERWSMVEIGRFLDGEQVAPPPAPASPAAAAPVPRGEAVSGTQDLIPGMEAVTAGPASAVTRDQSSTRRRHSVLPAIITALVAVLVVAIVLIAVQDDPQTDLAVDPVATPSASAPSSPTSPTQSTPTSPPSTPANPDVPRVKDLRNFIDTYLQLASRNPKKGFLLLTPAFQELSPRYDEFWGSVRKPELLDFSADTSRLTISYTYRYEQRGSGVRVDSERLQLVATDTGFLIDGSP